MSLLKNKSFSVKNVYYQVGYKDPSNFDHDFKKFTGMCPVKYRKTPYLFFLARVFITKSCTFLKDS